MNIIYLDKDDITFINQQTVAVHGGNFSLILNKKDIFDVFQFETSTTKYKNIK